MDMRYKVYKIMHELIDLQSIIEHYQVNLYKIERFTKRKTQEIYEIVFALKVVEVKLNV